MNNIGSIRLILSRVRNLVNRLFLLIDLRKNFDVL